MRPRTLMKHQSSSAESVQNTCEEQRAVRLCAGTTAGQDLNLSLDRVLGNRNLTNKLWNAGKFLQMQLTACTDSELADLAAADYSTPQSLANLPLVERWILSALHQVRCCPVMIVRQHKVFLVLGKSGIAISSGETLPHSGLLTGAVTNYAGFG